MRENWHGKPLETLTKDKKEENEKPLHILSIHLFTQQTAKQEKGKNICADCPKKKPTRQNSMASTCTTDLDAYEIHHSSLSRQK